MKQDYHFRVHPHHQGRCEKKPKTRKTSIFFTSGSTSLLFLEHLDNYLVLNPIPILSALNLLKIIQDDLPLANEQSRILHQHPRARA